MRFRSVLIGVGQRDVANARGFKLWSTCKNPQRANSLRAGLVGRYVVFAGLRNIVCVCAGAFVCVLYILPQSKHNWHHWAHHLCVHLCPHAIGFTA